MNTEQYLKDEFQVYPELFRELMVYFPSMECRQGLAAPEHHGYEHALRGVITQQIPGGLYTIHVDGKPIPPQKSVSLAKWTYLNSKQVDATTWSSPLLKNELYTSKRSQWNLSPDAHPWMFWLVNINIQQAIWSIHRQTKDYPLLNEDEQLLVDSVGAAVKLVRKSTVRHLKGLGVSLEAPATQELLNSMTADILCSRLKKAKKHLEALPSPFKERIFAYLREGASTPGKAA